MATVTWSASHNWASFLRLKPRRSVCVPSGFLYLTR